MQKKSYICSNIIFCVWFGLVAFSLARTQTDVSGTINENTIWTLASSPYIVTGSVTVLNGVTLTIDPGVEVKFDGHYSRNIEGNLN